MPFEMVFVLKKGADIRRQILRPSLVRRRAGVVVSAAAVARDFKGVVDDFIVGEILDCRLNTYMDNRTSSAHSVKTNNICVGMSLAKSLQKGLVVGGELRSVGSAFARV